MKTKNEDFMPNYVKIQRFILDKIHQGTYSPGDKIPSENELSQMFSVSRITANMAIKELSIMGIVNRQKGKGTFVCEPSGHQSPVKMPPSGPRLKPLADQTYHLEQTAIIEAYPELGSKFQMDEPAFVYEIVRSAHRGGGLLISLDFSYIPMDIIGYIPIQSDEIEKMHLYEYLYKHTACNPKYLNTYLNSPRYPFLKYNKEEFQGMDQLLFWNTDILDQRKRIIATTYTISLQENNGNPFTVFAIE